MTLLAVEGNPKFEVSRLEIESKQRSYTIDTLKKLIKQYGPRAEFFFITGSDSLKELVSWKQIDEIYKLSKFIVATRPGFPLREVPSEIQAVVITEIEVSASEIRKRLKERKSIRYLVPDKVREYIAAHHLYQ